MSDQNVLELSSEAGDNPGLGAYARQAYLEYALSVVKGRALPDVCDGQKPVQRRILYSMARMGLGYGGANASVAAKPVKSARVVGDVLGRYHPHGDQAAYDALVRMAQNFAQRYPLIDGQGNFGSRDGDGAAAMRYTEARLARISSLLLEEIDEGTERRGQVAAAGIIEEGTGKALPPALEHRQQRAVPEPRAAQRGAERRVVDRDDAPVSGGLVVAGDDLLVAKRFDRFEEFHIGSTARGRVRVTAIGRRPMRICDTACHILRFLSPRAGRALPRSGRRDRAPDDDPLDFTRAFVNLGDLRVAEQPFHRIIGDVSVAAVHLDRLRGDPHGGLARQQLAHCGMRPDGFAAVLRRRRRVGRPRTALGDHGQVLRRRRDRVRHRRRYLREDPWRLHDPGTGIPPRGTPAVRRVPAGHSRL